MRNVQSGTRIGHSERCAKIPTGRAERPIHNLCSAICCRMVKRQETHRRSDSVFSADSALSASAAPAFTGVDGTDWDTMPWPCER